MCIRDSPSLRDIALGCSVHFGWSIQDSPQLDSLSCFHPPRLRQSDISIPDILTVFPGEVINSLLRTEYQEPCNPLRLSLLFSNPVMNNPPQPVPGIIRDSLHPEIFWPEANQLRRHLLTE